MQVMPSTFDYVDRRAGSRAARSLVAVTRTPRPASSTCASCCASSAATRTRRWPPYYQGPASVRQNGLLPDTEQYVANVMALKARYGG